MLVSNTVSMFQNLVQYVSPQDDYCKKMFDTSTEVNVFLFISIRLISQDMFLIMCLYVFWASRRFKNSKSSGLSIPLRKEESDKSKDMMSPLEWGLESILSSN